MLSPLTSAHYKKSSPCTRMYVSKSLWKNGMDMLRLEKSYSLQGMSAMLSPPLCCIQGSVHCLSQFPTRAWLLCFGVLVRQSAVAVTPHQHESELNSRLRWRSGEGLQLGKRLPDMQHRDELPEVLPRRSVRPLCGALPYTTNVSGNVGVRRYLCWYRST